MMPFNKEEKNHPNYRSIQTEEQLTIEFDNSRPGDFIFYEDFTSQDFFNISYLIKPLCKCEHEDTKIIKTLKCKYEELTSFSIKNPGNRLSNLADFIKPKLKKLIGFDFDKTLTAYHTYSYENIPPPLKNARFPQDTAQVLNKFAERNDILVVIVTAHENKKVVTDHLEAWFGKWQSLIHDIQIRKDCDKNEFIDLIGLKNVQLGNIKFNLIDSKTNNGGFLSLIDLPNIIDFVQYYLVDDDKENIRKGISYNVTCFQVNNENNEHLIQLDKHFELGLQLSEKNFNLPKPTKLKNENEYEYESDTDYDSIEESLSESESGDVLKFQNSVSLDLPDLVDSEEIEESQTTEKNLNSLGR